MINREKKFEKLNQTHSDKDADRISGAIVDLRYVKVEIAHKFIKDLGGFEKFAE